MLYNESLCKGVFNFRLQPFASQGLKACPFCGQRDAEVLNTHTAHYWVECKCCGAEIPDPKSSQGTGPRAHRASALRAVGAWNTRLEAV